MITATISINGSPIILRGAINISITNEKGETKYVTDCGHIIWHKREDGAIELAKKMLDCVKELK